MSVDKYNSEGYHDPTVQEALNNINEQEKAARKAADFCLSEVYRPMVYVASPYAGDVEGNIERARKYCRFAAEQMAIPIAPHLLFPQFMDDSNPAERRLVCRMYNYVLLGKCTELWVFGSVISAGMAHEIDIAERRRMKIRYFTEDLEEITQ